MGNSENICKGCKIPCCDGCFEWNDDGECNIYKNRPMICRLFPWVYNPYNQKVQVLHTCPQCHYFEDMGCPDVEQVKKLTMERLKQEGY